MYRDDHDAALARAEALEVEVERLRDERDAAVRDRDAAVRDRDAADARRDAVNDDGDARRAAAWARRRLQIGSGGVSGYGMVLGLIALVAYLLTLADLIGVAVTGTRRIPGWMILPGSIVPLMFVVPGKRERGKLDDFPRWAFGLLAAHGLVAIAGFAWWTSVLGHAVALVFLASAALVAVFRRWH